tara:strand:- start:145 stop:351 length:207 start_codon:yes stop_codon:yes gene_type:complete
VERQWNRDPGWFYTLDRHRQVQLLADFHLTHETPEQTKKHQKRSKREVFEKHRNSYMQRHGMTAKGSN